MADVCVVGLGYIGLPTAATIASRGMDVLGVDINQRVVDTVNGGAIHIVEPELDIIVRSAVQSGRLRAATEVDQADVFLIAVPTPFDGDKKPNLEFVVAAGRSVAKVLKPGDLVILESTCPVGATEIMRDAMQDERSDLGFANGEADAVLVAHCPERVLPGKVLRELVENDRLIGGLDPASTEAACEFYRQFVEGECIATTARTAELAKLTENAFRDVNIAFANELSMICDRMGIDVWELISLANRHPRVSILSPGAGVGGHCIAVDPWFIVASAPEEARLIRCAREVNDFKPGFVLDRIRRRFEEVSGRRLGIIGLAFKPDVDDLRESPAVGIVKRIKDEMAFDEMVIIEPNIHNLPEDLAQDSRLRLGSLDDDMERVDLWVGLVRHTDAVRTLSERPVSDGKILDFVNIRHSGKSHK